MAREAVYLEIAEYIKNRINDGTYQSGMRLPTEREYAEQFDVNRITVHKAMKALNDEGLIFSSQGRGTYVSRPKIDTDMNLIEGTSSFFHEIGLKPGSKTLQCTIENPGYTISKALEIDEDTMICKLVRLRTGDDQPLSIEYVFIPYELVTGIEEYDLSVFSLSDLYEKNGIAPVKVHQVLSIVKLSNPQASFLECDEEEEGFLSEETAYDKSGRIIEYSQNYFSGRKFTFSSVKRWNG